jgi:hypothetical protein
LSVIVVSRLPPQHPRRAFTGHDKIRSESASESGGPLVVHVGADVEHVRPATCRGVEIEAEITGLDEVMVDLVGNPVRTRTVLFPWKGSIQIPFIDR